MSFGGRVCVRVCQQRMWLLKDCDFLLLDVHCASNRVTVQYTHTYIHTLPRWCLVKCNCNVVCCCCCHLHKCHVISSILTYTHSGTSGHTHPSSYTLTHSALQCAFITMWRQFQHDSVIKERKKTSSLRQWKEKEKAKSKMEWHKRSSNSQMEWEKEREKKKMKQNKTTPLKSYHVVLIKDANIIRWNMAPSNNEKARAKKQNKWKKLFPIHTNQSMVIAATLVFRYERVAFADFDANAFVVVAATADAAAAAVSMQSLWHRITQYLNAFSLCTVFTARRLTFDLWQPQTNSQHQQQQQSSSISQYTCTLIHPRPALKKQIQVDWKHEFQ